MIKHIFKLIWNKKKSNALMILEIFLAFLVLFFVLSYVFFNTERIATPIGFSTEDHWMITFDNIESKDSAEARSIMGNLKLNLQSEENIKGVSFSDGIAPFANNQWWTGNDDNGFDMNALVVPADYNLADVLDLNLIEGRWFNESDLNAAIKPIIVNKNFMDTYYPGKSMLDSTFIFDGERKLIGIVDEYRYMGEFDEPRKVTFNLQPYHDLMQNAILKMDSDVDIVYEEKLSRLVNNTTKLTGNNIVNLEKERQTNSRESWLLLISLLSVCGFLCINVALGLFGVLWYNINKRKSEIGLRQALGAHGFDITKQFILEMMILTGFALMIGIFFAIQIPLLDITEYDDGLFYKSIIFSSIIMLMLVLICALFPAVQAARITPANSLHED